MKDILKNILLGFQALFFIVLDIAFINVLIKLVTIALGISFHFAMGVYVWVIIALLAMVESEINSND